MNFSNKIYFRFQKKAMRNSLVRFGKRAPAEEQAAFAAEPEYAAYNSYGNAYAPFNQDPVLSQYRRFYNNYGF